MLTGRAGNRTSLTRIAVTAAILLTIAASGQALAQVTLRIEPLPVLFPEAGGEAELEIFIDNVPAPGLGSFTIRLLENDPGTLGFECLSFVRARLDSNLAVIWGGPPNNSNPDNSVPNELTWTAQAFQGFNGPTGTVRVGTITYRANIDPRPSSQCMVGTQNNFTWVAADSKYGTTISANTSFNSLRGTPWNIGPAQDRDLTISCTRNFDPNDVLAQVDPNDPSTPLDPNRYVDGMPLVVQCDVTNLGTVNVGLTRMIAVLSVDQIFNSTDLPLNTGPQFAVLAGATVTRSISISNATEFRTPGFFNICTKTDADRNNFDNVLGLVLETDEGNNVDCFPIEILSPRRDLAIDPDPNVTFAVPSALDPNQFHAGLLLQSHFDVQNRGIGAVRTSYTNDVLLAPTRGQALNDPDRYRICSKGFTFAPGQFQKGKTSRSLTFGFDTFPANPSLPPSNELCQIPFSLAPGGYSLVFVADKNNTVPELNPSGGSGEGNNAFDIPITVQAPLPPEFRVRDAELGVGQTRLRVFDDNDPTNSDRNPAPAGITLISAQNVAAHSWRLTWSPANLVRVDDPNDITFANFLEQNGRVQTCQVDTLDNTNGFVEGSCTSVPGSDPNATNAGATTPGNVVLAQIPLTANFPGTGALTLSNLLLKDPNNQDITVGKVTHGTLEVSGIPRMRVINAVPPAVVYPAVNFTTSYELENRGFGRRNTPISSRVVISLDSVTDPNVVTPDVIACQANEATPIQAFETRSKTLTCNLGSDLSPGQYTGFYQISLYSDPNTLNRQAVAPFPINPRIAALHRLSRRTTVVETFPEPDPNGTTGSALANSSRFNAGSIAVVRSGSRNLNWLAATMKGRYMQVVTVQALPKGFNDRLRVLTKLRLPPEDSRILGSIDIDGDGEEELMLLQRTSSGGEQIDFRRIDFTERRPLPCQSAAETPPNFFPASIVTATGIDTDGDPSTGDDLAVVTSDGNLHLYNLTLQGSIPPPSPCKPIPTIILEPGDAILVETASIMGFSTAGDEVMNICAMDTELDGIQEIVSLNRNASGDQSLKVYDFPTQPNDTPNLRLSDLAFSSGGAIQMIGCTR